MVTNKERIEHLEQHISILDEALRLLITTEKATLTPYSSDRWQLLDTIEIFVSQELDKLQNLSNAN